MPPSESEPLIDRGGEVRELTDGEVRQFCTLSQSLTRLTWMVGINSAFVFAVFTKLFLF
jgi:hypothetical protein